MKKWMSFLPAVLFYSVIFFLSSRNVRFDIDHLDKAGHLFEYGMLGLLLAIGFFNAFSLPLPIKFFLTFGSGLILAVLDEFHQFFVPWRRSDFLDVLADAAGLVLGISVFRYLAVWRKRKAPKPD